MSDPNQEQNLQELLPIQHTPLPDTEPQVAPLAVEEAVEASLPKASKTKNTKKVRIPPKVSGKFLGDEDLRALRSLNKEMVRRLGIRANNSRIV